ncbi:MAG: molecular chaperone DnaK [Coriobacteriia bacterium]|nr:molecular chaperone DnaK [Coriobacteriia bacterium]
MSMAIGIDLGTTNSCVAAVEGDKPTVIANAEGMRTLPSVVAFTKDGERLVGEPAVRQAVMNPDRTFASVKRHMGTDWRAHVDERDFTPQEISAMLLRKLKNDARAYLDDESICDAVITVPAYFNDMQRQATKDAGRIAGLNVLRIINEPTAAALAYGLDNEMKQKVMVYDLGGGTFDVSIIDISEGVIEVMSTSGNNHLGGDDFDEVLAKHLADVCKRDFNFDCKRVPEAWARIREAAEKAKCELSSADKTEVNLPFLGQGASGAVNFACTVTRSEFESMIASLIELTTEPVEQALYDAGIAASELDKVLLVGGSTRIPAVAAKVKSMTGKPASQSINPDECVAQGAAIQANTLANAANSLSVRGGDILLLDVCPLSLAIETVGGVATRLIERNTTLPTHYSQIFTTAAAFQTKVEIKVLQGERPMAADNKMIGNFQLKGIKRAPAGVPQIEVSFDIDANGIVTVSAKDLGTGNEQSITIENDQRMSDAEIEAAIRDAETYAAEDKVRRQNWEDYNEAGRLVREVDAAIARQGKTMDKEKKREIKKAANELRRYVSKKQEKLTDADRAAMKTAADSLSNLASDIISPKSE